MNDYFLWNADQTVFSFGSLHLYWYAVLIILSFILAIYFLRVLFRFDSKSTHHIQYLVLFIISIGLMFSKVGNSIFENQSILKGNSISWFLPFVLKPTIRFVGVHQLSLPMGILGIILAVWVYKKLFLKSQEFRFMLDRIAIVTCLVGALLFTACFINAGLLGKPTDSSDGVVFIRPITNGLLNLKCCMMRNPDGPNPLLDLQVKKGENKLMKEVGHKNIIFKATFNPDLEERTATEFIIGDIKTNLFEQPRFVKESGTEPIKYALSKMPNGNIVATINTIGVARYPVQLYLVLICFILFIVSYGYLQKNLKSIKYGFIAGLILTLFSISYFLILFITDLPISTPHFYGLWINQYLIMFTLLIGLILIYTSKRKSKTNA